MEWCMSQMTRTIHWPYCLSAGAVKSMGLSNLTRLPEFILLGLSSCPENQKPLFALFLIMYLVTLMGNLLIILAIRSDPQLQNPMYFFLSILSFADICYTTVIVPKMLVNFLSEKKTISYAECLVQMYFFLVFGNMIYTGIRKKDIIFMNLGSPTARSARWRVNFSLFFSFFPPINTHWTLKRTG